MLSIDSFMSFCLQPEGPLLTPLSLRLFGFLKGLRGRLPFRLPRQEAVLLFQKTSDNRLKLLVAYSLRSG